MTIGSLSFLNLSVKVTAIFFLWSIRPLPTLKELLLSMNIWPIIFLGVQSGGFLGFFICINVGKSDNFTIREFESKFEIIVFIKYIIQFR